MMTDEETIRLIGSQQMEIASLRRWKGEALLLLTQYDDIAESVGCPLGESKVDNLAKVVAMMRATLERIAQHNPDTCGGITPRDYFESVQEYARAAAAKEPTS